MWLTWICLLAAAATCVLGEMPLLLRTASEHIVPLTIEQISKVMREGDVSGKNHSTKLVISSYEPLYNVLEWEMLLHANDGNIISYTIKGDGSNPSTQTEFVFEDILVESDSIMLTAKNSSMTLARAYLVLDIQDLDSNVAWVGDEKINPSSSLRVFAGEPFVEVLVDEDSCTPDDSPCYYIKPKSKSSHIERCIDTFIGTTGKSVELCDERETPFQKMASTPPVSLREDGHLEVEFTFNKEYFRVEVVAYDPADHTKIFSNPGYQCRFPVGKMWTVGEKMKCLHYMTLPDNQKKIMVLVVKLDEDDEVFESNLQYIDESPSDVLTIEEISKVMKELETSDQKHNTKVIISPHSPLPDIVEWVLTLHTITGEFVTYSIKGDGSNPSMQTKLVFDGNLEESDSVVIQAKDSSREIAKGYLVLKIKDLKSNVAWVGDKKTSSFASMRVATNDPDIEILVDQEVCKSDDSPCYYITPQSKSAPVQGCVNIDIGTADEFVKLCDERMTPFQEMSSEPSITLHEGKMEVGFIYNKEHFLVEVVVYDHDDSSRVFSNLGYKCIFPIGEKLEVGKEWSCMHDLSVPEGQKEMMVLVVKINEDGEVFESSLQHFVDHEDDVKADNKRGIIIGSVIGSILGIALIAVIIMYFMKKKKKPTEVPDANYSKAATEDNKA